MKWFEKPVRMMRLDYIDQLSRMKRGDLDELARSKKQDWHINCEWIIGTPGIAPGLGYVTTFNTPKFPKYQELGDWDLIREYLPHAHKYGIRVLAYLNMHWFAEEFAAQHPEWEQVLADGMPYGKLHPLYGGGRTMCVNSPWRDWARDMIAEAMKCGLDGVFLDGPVMFPGACHCKFCREKFRARTGGGIPAEENWADPLWKAFIEFREDSMADFLAHCRKGLKEVAPEGVIFLNGGSWHAGGWRVARDIEKVGEHEDFNGAEAFFHPGPSQHVLHFWATAAKHLVAGGKPAVVFSHHALGSWHYLPLNPVEAQLAIAQTVACGANPWIAVFDYGLDANREYGVRPIREIQGFLEKNDAYYEDTRSAADVALLYSRQSGTYYISGQDGIYGDVGSGQERDLIADTGTGATIEDLRHRKSVCDGICSNSYLGYFTTLTREHVPFDVVLDSQLTAEQLSRYRTLILGNAACLSDAQAEAIRAYVEAGGSVFAEFETGAFDENGAPRKSNPLAEMLGLRSKPEAMSVAYGEEYLTVKGDNAVTSCFVDGQLLPRPPYAMKAEFAGDAQALLYYNAPIGKLYAALTPATDAPALIARKVGKGRVAYTPALMGEFYGRYRMEQYQQLLGAVVRWLRDAPALVEADCPASVEVELREQPETGRTLVHLVNNTGDMQRPITEIIPLRDVKVRLRRSGVKSVRALWLEKDLPFRQDGEVCEFTVPDLKLYEVISLE